MFERERHWWEDTAKTIMRGKHSQLLSLPTAWFPVDFVVDGVDEVLDVQLILHIRDCSLQSLQNLYGFGVFFLLKE